MDDEYKVKVIITIFKNGEIGHRIDKNEATVEDYMLAIAEMERVKQKMISEINEVICEQADAVFSCRAIKRGD